MRSSLSATGSGGRQGGSGSPCPQRAAQPGSPTRMFDFSASVVTHVFLQSPLGPLHRSFLADTGAHLTASFLTPSTECSDMGSVPTLLHSLAPQFWARDFSTLSLPGVTTRRRCWQLPHTLVQGTSWSDNWMVLAVTSRASAGLREGSRGDQSFVTSHIGPAVACVQHPLLNQGVLSLEVTWKLQTGNKDHTRGNA